MEHIQHFFYGLSQRTGADLSLSTDKAAMDSLRVRNLRIVQWADGKPFRGQCTRCERIFTLHHEAMDVQNARDQLESQFRNHGCEEPRPYRKMA